MKLFITISVWSKSNLLVSLLFSAALDGDKWSNFKSEVVLILKIEVWIVFIEKKYIRVWFR